jgi:hypothetical protein
MNNPSELNAQVEAHLRAIWKGGSVVQPIWTPEQVRARALHFEAHAKKLARLDLVSFLLLPVVLVGALFFVDARALMHHPWGRIQLAGWLLLFLCSLLGIYWSRRYSHAAVTSNANDLMASHLERLARMRDWLASAPWGTALYLPGAALVMVGTGMSPTSGGWEKPILWTGVAVFAYIASCIHAKIKARGLQREIDSLEALRPRAS